MQQKPPHPPDATPTEPATPEALRRRDSGEYDLPAQRIRCPSCRDGRANSPTECDVCHGRGHVTAHEFAAWAAISQGRRP